MRISDWSSDVCSSDLNIAPARLQTMGATPLSDAALFKSRLTDHRGRHTCWPLVARQPNRPPSCARARCRSISWPDQQDGSARAPSTIMPASIYAVVLDQPPRSDNAAAGGNVVIPDRSGSDLQIGRAHV